MQSKYDIQIFIDHFGLDEDTNFAKNFKRQLITHIDNSRVKVTTFSDLDYSEELFSEDPNNEKATLESIKQAIIVIPIISSGYLSFVTDPIKKQFKEAASSDEKYLFPILFGEADWSNLDWVVKSQLTPSNSVPLNTYDEASQGNITNQLVKLIGNIVINTLNNENKINTPKEDYQNNNFVFISHDHDDSDFAELLKLKLEKEGIECWLDTERLRIGQDWREEIDAGIQQSICVIAIMTPEARKSEYVTYEWSFAWGKSKKVFPLMLKQTQLHPRLESLQYLNFTNKAARPWNDLINSIKPLIG